MRLSRATVMVTCAFVVALVMGATIHNGFVYDDVAVIVGNVRIADPAHWREILGSPYWFGTLWRPVTTFSFAVQWWLSHGAPWFFHAVSLVAYLGVGCLLFILLRRFGIGIAAAFAATVIFLVHPVHVEVVANVVGQSELWVALTLLGTTLLYLRVRTHGQTMGSLCTLLLVVAIGIMAKEQGFVAPLLLLGAELLLIPSTGEGWWTRARTLLLVTALAVILLLVRSNVTGTIRGETPAIAFRGAGFGGRAMTFLGTVPEYARLLVWPWHLQADYGPPQIPVGGPFTLRHLLGVLLLIAFCTVLCRTRRGAPVAAFGLWWAAVALAPVSNLLAATGIVMAERVFFLPTLGFVIALAVGLDALSVAPVSRPLRQAVFAGLAAWGVAAAIRSHLRVPVWHDQLVFFARMPLDAPRSFHAWQVTGTYWADAQEPAEAERDFRTSLGLWPNNLEVREDLGQLLRAQGHCDEAIPVLEAGVPFNPEVAKLRAKLVECLMVEHQWDAANRYAREGVALGQTQFEVELERVARARAAVDSVTSQP